MRKIVRLTEQDLTRLVRRVIKENDEERNVIDFETGDMVGTYKYGVGFVVNKIGERMGYESHPTSIPDGTKMEKSDHELGMKTKIRNELEKERNYRNELGMDRDDFSSLRIREENENIDRHLRNIVRGFRTEEPKDFTEIISDISDLIENSEDVNNFKMKIKQYTNDNQEDLNGITYYEKNQLDGFINSVITSHNFETGEDKLNY